MICYLETMITELAGSLRRRFLDDNPTRIQLPICSFS